MCATGASFDVSGTRLVPSARGQIDSRQRCAGYSALTPLALMSLAYCALGFPTEQQHILSTSCWHVMQDWILDSHAGQV